MMLVPAGPMDDMGFFDTLVLSVGAGTYEELFFRVGLLGAARFAFSKTALGDGARAAALAIVVSSLMFSAFHYPPIGLDPWELWSFVFRVLMGVFFAVLYWTRGFAVAVYTHAIYDIIVLLG
jgi:membrane protease YdiL (CAAX protease family)